MPTDINIEDCIALIEDFVENPGHLSLLPSEQRIALVIAAGKLSRPTKFEQRRRRNVVKKNKEERRREYERNIRKATGIRTARRSTVFTAPKELLTGPAIAPKEKARLASPRNCYICKAEFIELHHFYDTMCSDCAEFNYQKRFQTASLDGQVALITGSRLKIGYQATLMMLRAGAEVIATTRFPIDSAKRYAKEEDFAQWGHRLHIYGLDLRHTPSVELFCEFFTKTYKRLDLLVNNAAQTVRRPTGFYAHLMKDELAGIATLNENAQSLLRDAEACKRHLLGGNISDSPLPIAWNRKEPGIGMRASAELSQIPYPYDSSLSVKEVFPEGKLDADLQQVDLRKTNSWRLRIGDIETSEMFEIQLVNAVAPFVLCNKLSPLMKQENTGKKHIVNVSAMEGKFQRFNKADRHPHTNMAKAALNMLTHTCATDLAKSGIFINAVDTGWVTDEDPADLSAYKQAVHDFQPPLDIVDGAARVCDPFFHGILSKTHWSGKFLKDYHPIDW
jgi:NAD(P)-dependent dehydrogenase (short-subunit alcohol dehydrogenase family)